MTGPAADRAARDLVALVGSRMAHDLANPVGAIANGLELLALTGLDSSPELTLIAESVENARDRIKRFRIAFGAAAPGQVVAAAEIGALTAPGSGPRRVEIDWPVAGDLARTEAKLALLALMCIESALPLGGAVRVRHEAGRLQITAEAERMNAKPALWDYLAGAAGPPDDIAAAEVQFLLLPVEAAAQHRPFRVDRTDSTLAITL